MNLRERTIEAARAAFLKADYRYAIGTWAGGNNSWTVTLGDAPAISGDSKKVWSKNGKWSGLNGIFSATVPANWIRTVEKPGLAVVDGLFTLAARKTDSPWKGAESWKAVWAVQSRGFALNLETGYIFRYRGVLTHAQSIAAAQRQIKKIRLSKLLARLDGDVSKFGDTLVTRRDSLHAGNCETGTDSWIATHLPGRDSATVAELLAIGKENPRVAAACRVAIGGAK